MSNVSPVSTMGSMDPIMARDPNYVAQMLRAQRAQAMANALTEQGLAKIDYDPKGAISPLQGLAKMLQAYSGNKMAQSAIDQQSGATTAGMNALTNAFQPQPLSPQQTAAATGSRDFDAGQAALGVATPPADPWAGMQQGNNGAGPTNQSAQLANSIAASMPVPQSRPSPLNPMGLDPQLAATAYMKDPNEYFKAQLGAVAPTNEMKNWKATGTDLNAIGQGNNREAAVKGLTPEIQNAQYMGKTKQQMLAASLAADKKAGEVERRGGNEFQNFYTGDSGIVPIIPHNANPVGPIASNGALTGGVAPIPGAVPIAGATAKATARGTATGGFHEITRPDGSKEVVPGDQIAPEPGVQGAFTGKPDDVVAQISAINDPQERANAMAAFLSQAKGLPPGATQLTNQAPIAQGQPTAAKVASEGAAKNAVAAYGELHNFATASAPRNIGLLQSIQQMADKTLTGYGSDKVQFVNGVLNMMGVRPGADSAQNYQLMSKNLNMLVGSQRMGSEGGGSDALQHLLEASNPNVSTMNAPALKEAAGELIAYNRMMMSKDRLAPNPTTTTPEHYAQFETKFAPFADPRLWQMHHATDDKERQRLLSLIPAQEQPAFMSKAKAAIASGLFNQQGQ